MSKPSDLSGYRERTRMVRAGLDPAEQHGFLNTPVYRGSTVLYPTLDALKARRGRYTYGTRGTPTTEALETA
jgi:cysteine-S-conjugate beta-lyase